MYGQAADARRQPSPPASRHGHGRPPEGQPTRSWGFSHAISSFLGWSQQETEALPPLVLSGPHARSDVGHLEGEVHRQPDAATGYIQSNGAGCATHWTAKLLPMCLGL